MKLIAEVFGTGGRRLTLWRDGRGVLALRQDYFGWLPGYLHRWGRWSFVLVAGVLLAGATSGCLVKVRYDQVDSSGTGLIGFQVFEGRKNTLTVTVSVVTDEVTSVDVYGLNKHETFVP